MTRTERVEALTARATDMIQHSPTVTSDVAQRLWGLLWHVAPKPDGFGCPCEAMLRKIEETIASIEDEE